MATSLDPTDEQPLGAALPKTKRLEHWVLSEVGTPKAWPFSWSHLAFESLEATYRKEVEEGSFQVDWNAGHTHAVITVGRLSIYHLGISSVEAYAVPILIPRHRDTEIKIRKQVAEQLAALDECWTRLNNDKPLRGAEAAEMRNIVSSTKALIRTLSGY